MLLWGHQKSAESLYSSGLQMLTGCYSLPIVLPLSPQLESPVKFIFLFITSKKKFITVSLTFDQL